MAQMQDTQRLVSTGQTNSISTLTNLLGAAASLALLIGVGVWGYKILMRDVTGVPVVRAADGPFRVQPENPGGEQAPHQGLSVNGVAAEGMAADPADRLMLAPAPLDLTQEDAVPVAAPRKTPETPPVAGPAARAVLAAGDETVQLAAVERLAERLAVGVAPLEGLAPAPQAKPDSAELPKAEVEVEPAPMVEQAIAQVRVEDGLGRSLRPRRRPAELSNVRSVAALPADAVPEADPATIPAGTRLAQLGAYDSAETARSEWERLQGRFGDYLEDKTRVVQKASSGGRTFYRLRAMGFADLSDARRFCSALVAEKAGCIPVVTR